MMFQCTYPALLPDSSAAVGPDVQHRLWDYGMEVAGDCKRYPKKQTPTLEAGMCGFARGEELLAVKGYLYSHGAYQLVAVSRIVCHVTGRIGFLFLSVLVVVWYDELL